MTWTILRITLLRLRNNPLELMLVFVVPIVFFSIFAMIFSNGIAAGKNIQLKIGWVDPAQSDLSLELYSVLERQETLSCRSIGEAASDDEARTLTEEAQRQGKFDLLIRIPGDFELTRDGDPPELFLVSDGQNPMAISMVESVIRGFFAERGIQELIERNRGIARQTLEAQRIQRRQAEDRERAAAMPSAGFESLDDPARLFSPDGRPQPLLTENGSRIDVSGIPPLQRPPALADTPPHDTAGSGESNPAAASVRAALELVESSTGDVADPVTIRIQEPQSESHTNPRIALYAAGIAVLFLLFSSTGTAATLLEERESGTLDRILASQADMVQVWTGKWLGIYLLGCVQITVMFLWAEAVFQIQLFDHLPGFAVMTLATAAATASFAMLLATVCRSRAQLNAVSTIIILSMSAVGGSMIPRFVMSEKMKEFGRWTFNAWALDGYQKVFWYQLPVSSLRLEILVLCSSAFILSAVSLFIANRWSQ